ncbi:MAG: bifunctional diaminohydroxyphosphoribosylaminopyrimidine deaminase/5-amino-6-(5-phosphoribosylamino)uracil reductase RibD [Woeseiaceae bacterium]|nr:bifunctional diaminohydroxyphosphoribosylaminopyrimidine deaminase/5-amino-6-(5-phosphoribosylamino)uracil reductase RibD [Woeseiaceae bacterium]
MTASSDSAYMAQALRLAENGLYTAMPNPIVGCVIVKDGKVVGEGWHRVAGEAHAEINALEAAGEDARGATAYVTLEPCAHHGKTPPCAEALVAAGVVDVVIGVRDPHPAVDGRGIRILEEAGINVRSGILADDTERQLEGFLSRVTRSRPFVRLKMACSLDGCIAMSSGESQWITGPEARSDVQRLRARSGAVLTGIGTVLADDPSLTVRDPAIDSGGRQPLRVVLDDNLRMPLAAEMLALPGETLVYCTSDANREALVEAGAEVVKVGAREGRVDAAAVLSDLAVREINDVLVEAGPVLAGGLVSEDLVDELVIYQAPHIMGSETRGMFRTPTWTALSDRRRLDIIDSCQVGPDTRITARFTDQ